uniref:hypothetical protein n=1 Tax=Nonomuraea sp. CA-252377 TaxID=3240003 RepID=UPI003F491B9D
MVLLLTVGLLWFAFRNETARVDPAVLTELRALGQVVGEDTGTFHEWENDYLEIEYLVVHLGGSAEEDPVVEVERRLTQAGWYMDDRQPSEISLKSAKWSYTTIGVQRLSEVADVRDELRAAVARSGLASDKMVYLSVYPWGTVTETAGARS